MTPSQAVAYQDASAPCLEPTRDSVPPFLLQQRGDCDSHRSLLARCYAVRGEHSQQQELVGAGKLPAEKLRPELKFRDLTDAGNPRASQRNIRTFMLWFGIRVRYDEFSGEYTVIGVPHRSVLDDEAFGDIYTALDAFGVTCKKDYLWTILEAMGREHCHNPLLEFIDSLEWDGVPRLDTALVRHLGADDCDYVHAVTAKFFIGAIARLRHPGCKMDNVLTLDGAEGLGKSTFLQIIGYDLFFTDNLPLAADGKIVIEQTRGKWIAELAEIVGMSKREDEEIKAFITRQTDEGRKAYDRKTSGRPRQFVMAATTNKAKPFKDQTGNRRWWLVHCSKQCDFEGLKTERDQLWAEAAAREANGEVHWLSPELEDQARQAQKAALRLPPMQERLEEYLSDHVGFVPKEELYAALKLADTSRRNNQHGELIENAMRRLGWTESRVRMRNKTRELRERGYKSPGCPAEYSVLRFNNHGFEPMSQADWLASPRNRMSDF